MWPLQLPHCSLRLFRTREDSAAVHAAAPAWALKGDFKCTDDMNVEIGLLESGLQFLQSVAQIQKGLVCTFRGTGRRGGRYTPDATHQSTVPMALHDRLRTVACKRSIS